MTTNAKVQLNISKIMPARKKHTRTWGVNATIEEHTTHTHTHNTHTQHTQHTHTNTQTHTHIPTPRARAHTHTHTSMYDET